MALPVKGSTHLIPALLLIYRPSKDERLSWPSFLTWSGWFTHISGHPSAAGRAQDRESSPVRDRRSITVLRHQLAESNGNLFTYPVDFYRAMLRIRGTSHGHVSVSVSVCLSQVGVLLKRLNRGSHKQHHTIVQEL